MRFQASEALAAHVVEDDHVKIWRTVGKLCRRHGLLMSGEPREPGYWVEDWTWEAKRVRSTVRAVETGASETKVSRYKVQLTRETASSPGQRR